MVASHNVETEEVAQKKPKRGREQKLAGGAYRNNIIDMMSMFAFRIHPTLCAPTCINNT